MADSSTKPAAAADRRSFLKIGAGVVAGAAIASVVEIPYYSSVIGSNNNSSSTTLSSLQNQLASTQTQLNDTQSSLSSAQNTISSLNSQLSNAQGSLSAANSQNTSLNQQLTATQGSLTSANNSISNLQSQVTSANGQVTSLQSQVSSANSQVTSLQTQIDSTTGFVYLNVNEQSLLPAVLATIIPTDSNGPGATEAGVVYFIDRQLASDYGTMGTNYVQPPFILPNIAGPVTVEGTLYPHGTPQFSVYSGAGYQYSLNLRYFWRAGLDALQAYANSAYGGNFETLSATQQTQVLTDLWNNKPTSFNSIVPVDFAYELFLMAWSGFLADPMYGGNRNMVGWTYTGFSGVNQGDFYGEGHTLKELMVASTPTRLQPVSLAQYQKGSP